MRLDGFGIFVDDMAVMVRFYRDVLGFEIKEDEKTQEYKLLLTLNDTCWSDGSTKLSAKYTKQKITKQFKMMPKRK